MISSVGSMSPSMASMRPMGPPPSKEEAFSKMDEDASGSLNVDELQGMAEMISKRTGEEVSTEDLLDELDSDGNGTVEMGEMPEPPSGPPPFMNADGSFKSSEQQASSFNPQQSLLDYLSASQTEDEETSSFLELTA